MANTSLSCNGTTTRAITGSISTFSLANTFSVAAWVKQTSTSGTQRFMAVDAGWGMAISAGQLQFTTFGVKDYFDSSGFRTSTGTWYHICAVMDSSNGVTFYVNGALKSTVTGTTASGTSASTFCVGARNAAADFFAGLIDEARVFNVALSSTNVGNLYTGTTPSGQIGAWLFDEGTGTTAADSQGANNLTITSGAWSSDVPTIGAVASHNLSLLGVGA